MIHSFLRATAILLLALCCSSCQKNEDPSPPDPSDDLALDSIRATKKVINVWEVITVTAYARGQNLSFHWTANHGTLVTCDSVAVDYWACSSCVGINTIECSVSNEFGSISDTIMINVLP
jgi:hypothetical protein